MRRIVKQVLAVTLSAAMAFAPVPGFDGATARVRAAGIADEYEIPAANASGVIGATVPYTRYDSKEASIGGGAALAESKDWDTANLATQASEQSYVTLPGNGAYAEWTMKTTGSGVTMRFTMPDSGDGMGQKGSLDVYVNGNKQKTVNLDSFWMWQYGNHEDTPGDTPEFSFDEVHFMLDKPLQQGDTIRVQSTGANGLEYGVDFLEIENVPDPIEQPDNSVSVEDYGAIPDDGQDDLAAFKRAVEEADSSGMDVYIPAGTFHMSGMWNVYCENMKITGAGMWYTNIQFTSPEQSGGGISGGNPSGGGADGRCRNLEFCNMYLNSGLRSRYGENAIYKAFMDIFSDGSVIHDIWEEHFECGFWFADYNGDVNYCDGVKVVNCRIRNNLADGVNFCQGTSDAAVYNCSIRNNGDDGLAMWNNNAMGAKDESNNVFAYNTIDLIWRAGGIAIYGGDSHKIYNNYICDMYLASGIHLNTTFPGYAFGNCKKITFDNNILVRCGTDADLYQEDLSAVDIKGDVKNITFTNTQIYDSPSTAIRIMGGGYGDITFNDTKIYGAGISGRESSYSCSFPHTGAAVRESNSTEAVFNGLEVAGVRKFSNSSITSWPFYTDNSQPANLYANDTVHILDDDTTYTVPSYPDPVAGQQGGGVVDPLEGVTGYDVELAGLSWQNQSGSTSLEEDDVVTFTAAIKNPTNVDIPEGVAIQLKITVDGKGSYTNISYKDGLKAGQTVKLSATAKWTAQPGGHTILATVDYQNKLPSESSEDNNEREKKVNVQAVPDKEPAYTPVTGRYDIVVTKVTWDKEIINVGDQLTFTATIVNAGDQPVPSGSKLGVQFDVDGQMYPSPITWSDNYYDGLEPGQTVRLTANGGNNGSSWTAVEGTHTVTAWADDSDIFGEQNESNNKASATITVPFGGIQYFDEPDEPDDLDAAGGEPSTGKPEETTAAQPEETTTAQPEETPTVNPSPVSASVIINGYQISAVAEGYRTVYTLTDPAKEVHSEGDVAKVGMLYAPFNQLADADSEMVIGGSNKNVISYAATEKGKLDVSTGENSQSYVMTMKFMTNPTATFFNTQWCVRAYAQLSDGRYIYSSPEKFTIYKVADFLYQNLLMSNQAAHEYLYDHILSVANSGYVKKSFDWNDAVVKPGDLHPGGETKPSEETSTEKPDETQTQKPEETQKESESGTAKETESVTEPETAKETQTEAQTETQTESPSEQETESIYIPDGEDEPDKISNLAEGKNVTASSYTQTFMPGNAVDGDTGTYWEGGSAPADLTISLGTDADISYITVKLNPGYEWAARTQRIAVNGRLQGQDAFTQLAASQDYQFDPATGNQVTIQAEGKAADVQLVFESNTGSGAGQAAEVEIYGIPADNPDLKVTGIGWNKNPLYENEELVLGAAVKNRGTKDSTATKLTFYLNDEKKATVDVPALTAGESSDVQADIGMLDAGDYTVTAVVDEDGEIAEKYEDNNSFTLDGTIKVQEVESVDLEPVVSWVPSNPSKGANTQFNVQIYNNGNQPTKDTAHAVTVTIKSEQGDTVETLTQTAQGIIEAKGSVTVAMGEWTVGDGKFDVEVTVAADSGELDVKRKNNTATSSLYVGRGADMPFTVLEAENANTNGDVLEKNFNLADFAGEASGRSAVKLDQEGEYVEFTLTSAANAFVLRNAVNEGVNGTLSIYADGNKVGTFNVTSKFSRVNCSPTTLNDLGFERGGDTVYWLYEDAQLLLDRTYPAGTKIKVQKDAGDVEWVYVDLLETEAVAPAAANPDPDQYVEVSGSKEIEDALNEARMNSKKGIFIPEGEWTLSSMITVYGGAFEILGAGPWHTKLVVPQDQNNTDAGFRIAEDASGSSIRDLSAWGNYTYRQDGPGKFINGDKMTHVTVENVWVEHFVCLYWGVGSSDNTFRNCRIKNIFADGINMTNGSNNNVITNCYARATGDDSFALFSATDNGGDYNVGNRYSNLTAVCPRRAACFAIYGGSDNTFENLYGADTLTYPGITMSSLSFGYQTKGFGDKECLVENVTLDRCGGDFYTSNGSDDHFNDYQNFGAIWIYAGDRIFQNVTLRNIDINDAVYYGIQIQTMYSGGPASDPMKNVLLENININHANRQGIKFVVKAEDGQGPCVGSATFRNVQVNNAKLGSVYGLDRCPDFTATKEDCNW